MNDNTILFKKGLKEFLVKQTVCNLHFEDLSEQRTIKTICKMLYRTFYLKSNVELSE